MSSSDEFIFDIITDEEIIHISNLKKNLLEYEKSLALTLGKQFSNINILDNIEFNAKLFYKLWHGEFKDTICDQKSNCRTMITVDIGENIVKLIYLHNNMNVDIAKSILNIIITNKLVYLFNSKRISDFFANYFIDIDILKKISVFINNSGNRFISTNIGNYITDNMLFDVFNKINEDSKNIIDSQIDKFKKIIYNLNVLHYDLEMCTIVDFLYKHKQKCNAEKYKRQYDFILELNNYIYYELNLLNTIEYGDFLQKMLDKYK